MSKAIAGLGCAWIVIFFSTFPAWLTHVIVTIQNEQWVFLLAGAIFAPIGIIHGWGIWFGVF